MCTHAPRRSTEDKAQQLLDDSPKAAKEVDVSRLVAREEHPEVPASVRGFGGPGMADAVP